MNGPRGGLKQRAFAWAMFRFSFRFERFAGPYKKGLFAGLNGTVLEIGPGTGINLRYMKSGGVRWIGVEPNLHMKSYVVEEAARLGISVDLRVGTADNLPVPDATIDAVICTLVLCCVPDQQRSLGEIMRVLKPGGRFLFMEHVAAPAGSRLRRTQNWLTPIWKRLGDGCYPNRETARALESAGFAQLEYERVTAPLPVVSPQIVGAAVKA